MWKKTNIIIDKSGLEFTKDQLEELTTNLIQKDLNKLESLLIMLRQGINECGQDN